MLAVLSQFFFACNSARQYEFSNNSQAYHSPAAQAKADPAVVTESKTEIAAATVTAPESAPENLSAKAGVTEPDLNLRKMEVTEVSAAKENIEIQKFPVTKLQKKELRSALKELKKQAVQGNESKPTVDILQLILAIIIPPVGVLLHEGGLNGKFWISLLLTLLFYFPGMIYAVLVVTDTI